MSGEDVSTATAAEPKPSARDGKASFQVEIDAVVLVVAHLAGQAGQFGVAVPGGEERAGRHPGPLGRGVGGDLQGDDGHAIPAGGGAWVVLGFQDVEAVRLDLGEGE